MRSLPARLAAAVLATSALVAGAVPGLAADAEKPLHHAVNVRLEPAAHRIDGTDDLTVPPSKRKVPFEFQIHAGLDVSSADGTWDVRPVEDAAGAKEAPSPGEQQGKPLRVRRWTATPVGATSGATSGATGAAWPGDAPLKLKFSGEIHHPLETGGEEYSRSFSQTPGTIEDQGVVISGSTWWLPSLGDGLMTFTLTANVPPDWDVVSQGKRTFHALVHAAGDGADQRRVVTWDCAQPMDEVYLIAARFTEYERPAGNIVAQAFLRTPDPNMAAKYLEATAQYLDMYWKLLGPYPFEKFALVENFWETGYGMPSFTLLGPQIIRFPFILHSSYPHEILHNWWGNSVYVDWSQGNWCEGLTAYLADHLIREGQGRGTEYRNDTLKGYRSYVGDARDFPLTEFRSRHSSATQAVGYGKCLMLWHMLRVRMGDALFVKALQKFYRKNQFKVAAWADIEPVFSEVAGADLKPFFKQWTTQTGALALAVESSAGTESGFMLSLKQTQAGEPYSGVDVPIAVTYAGRETAEIVRAHLDGAQTVVMFPTGGAQVVRIDIDPEFDVFRALDQSETPPTLSEMFGAEHVTLIVPSKDAPLAAEWAVFAATWAASAKDVAMVSEDAIDAIPAGRAVWALGAANRFGPQVIASLASLGAKVDASEARFGVEFVPRAAHSFVYVARHPSDAKLAAGWVGTDVAAAIPGLGRKLPHYGKYSYLAFTGEAPDNVVKGAWPATDSPLVHFVGEGVTTHPARGKLPPRTALAKLAPVFDPGRLSGHVKFLADDAQEGRGVGTAGLDRSGDYIAKAFADAGIKPAGTGAAGAAWFDAWTEENGPDGKPATLRNVIGMIPGTNPALNGQCVVIGAHYDHLGLGWPDVREGQAGKIHNGADDNASGVAVLLEVAKLLGNDLKPGRTIVFVAFSGEEWGLKGSKRFVATQKIGTPFAMVNLDTVGRLGDKKLLVLGAGTASEWRHIAMGVGFTTGIESTCIADDPGGSDQKSFHDAGVPAVQLFTGPHADYHRPTDDVEKVDVDGLVKISTWLRETIVYLGERPEPLTSSLPAAGTSPPKPASAGGASGEGGRRASLGTMPDFEFAGPGVRVASVIEGSPAQKAGIATGDIVLSIDGAPIEDLRAYSTVLKAHKPGDVVKLRIRRGDTEQDLQATLVAR
ncbi:MAG: M20/M25/M40 family metallo-hydrolase [Planctomycetes bacterium]|nr:M20/M25/M40 family metallo-hydrolase [Planctomycetota bacterium]